MRSPYRASPRHSSFAAVCLVSLWFAAGPYGSTTSTQMPVDPAEAAAFYESDAEEWADGPVQYIFTSAEAADWKELNSERERRRFIQWFWDRRDDDLRTPDNPFKEGFYVRVAFANRRFSGFPRGWRSDRGRVWVILGRPDSMRTDAGSGLEIWTYFTYGGILRASSYLGEMQAAFQQTDTSRWEIYGGFGPGAWPDYLLRAFGVVNEATIVDPFLERGSGSKRTP